MTKYKTIEEVHAKNPEAMTVHLERSNKLHNEGKVIMADAFLDRPGEPLTTMGSLLHPRSSRRVCKRRFVLT